MTHRRLLALFVGLAAIACSSSPALAATHGPRHSDGRGSSTNWSGYAVAGSSATHVVGTWTQPLAICSSGENSWSSPWVGIDGDNSNTVEQIGTDSDCSGGAPYYYAWYEMYPKSLVKLSLPVVAGHSYTAEVTYTSGSFALSLTDNTTGTPVSAPPQASRKARRSSIEWVMEGPSNGLLTDFSTVSFTSASGTIGGVTGAVDSFANPDAITMVTRSGLARATPGTASGGAFDVTWNHR